MEKTQEENVSEYANGRVTIVQKKEKEKRDRESIDGGTLVPLRRRERDKRNLRDARRDYGILVISSRVMHVRFLTLEPKRL